MANSPPHPASAAACGLRDAARGATEVERDGDGLAEPDGETDRDGDVGPVRDGDVGTVRDGDGDAETDGVGLGPPAFAGPATKPAVTSPLNSAADNQRTTPSP